HQVLRGLLDEGRDEEHEDDEPPSFSRFRRNSEEHEGGRDEALPGAEDVDPGEEGDDVGGAPGHHTIVEGGIARQEPDREHHHGERNEEGRASEREAAPAVSMRAHDVQIVYERVAWSTMATGNRGPRVGSRGSSP